MIKCPECGIEYSYGRNLCHACEKSIIFNGAIFSDDRRNYAWNCSGGEEKVYHPKLKELPECLDLRKEAPKLYEWNCMHAIRLVSIEIEEKNNFQLIYE